MTTLNAGAGLESAIVFLAGLRQLFEEEQSLRLSDDEREMLIRDNTKKIIYGRYQSRPEIGVDLYRGTA
ncbi:MAG: hypothetical protein IPN58_19410 [Anaerolineales bacterium]|nr:hypothetical protein [Anaerolineales bacterium]